MKDRKTVFLAFWVAVVISVALNSFQPWGRYALYPFAMLSTWAHEMGHGLTAILTGGSFSHLYLYKNLGGTAYCSAGYPFLRPLVSMGGLLGPSILGGFIIAQSARSTFRSQLILMLLACLMVFSWVIWVRNFFGFFAAGGLSAFLCALAFLAPEKIRVAAVQLIGIQLCLGSLSDFDYMLTKQFVRDGQVLNSDSQNIAEYWLLPYWVWGGLIAATSVLIMLFAFYVAWIRPGIAGMQQAGNKIR